MRLKMSKTRITSRNTIDTDKIPILLLETVLLSEEAQASFKLKIEVTRLNHSTFYLKICLTHNLGV